MEDSTLNYLVSFILNNAQLLETLFASISFKKRF